LLLSTSLTVPDILRGQRLALQRQFLGPLGLALLAEFVMLIAGLGEMRSGSDLSAWVCLCVALMVMLVADLITLYWVGMWMSLSAKNPRRASSSTVIRVLVLPWIGCVMFLTFALLVSVLFREEIFGWQSYLGVWFGLGLVTDVGYGLWARRNLLTKFRQLAEQRYERRAPLWKRLFGKHAETVVAARPRAVAP
jgi:hypothetical protein